MHAIVSVCTASGALRRYERVGDGTARLTHDFVPDGWAPGWEYERGAIETFRTEPHADCAVTETPLLKPEHTAPWQLTPNDAA